jgi:hypothetical protein
MSAIRSVAAPEQAGLSDFIRFLLDEHLRILMRERDVIADENARLRAIIQARTTLRRMRVL